MKTILYLFDDINYVSGVQKVMFFQMKCLSSDYRIHAFSLSRPEKGIDLEGVPIIGEEIWEKSESFCKGFWEVFFSKRVSVFRKISRFCYAFLRRIGKEEIYVTSLFYSEIKPILESYDVVIVVSEASKLRKMVSQLKHPKKVQWIHTDYALWSEFSDWTRMITKKDASIYAGFDMIVTLSKSGRKGFLKKLPQLKEKTVVIPNFIDGETILKKAEEEFSLDWEEGIVHLLTVGRLEKEKAYDRILDLCKKMQKAGISFCWYFVGDGSQKRHLERRIATEYLDRQVKLLGKLENPYPLMKRCDSMVLLSEYEGTPVTIDEAMVLGISVVAKDVGGITEQLKRGTGKYFIIKSEMNEELYQEIKGGEEGNSPFDFYVWNQSVLSRIKKLLD